MSETKQSTFQNIAGALANSARKGTTQFAIDKIKSIENEFLKITWVFFVLGFIIASFLTSIILFIYKLISEGDSAITYNAVFIGFIISILFGIIFGFIFKYAQYRKMKEKFAEMIKKIEDFDF